MKEVILMTFGEKLRQSRNAKRMTQKELATEVGAKHNSISDWENDKNRPDPDTIELLCGVLGITPNYLLNASDGDLSLPEKNMIKKYRALNSDSQKYVSEVIDREYRRDSRLVEGQISLIPENGYVQIYKNGKWQDYMKADDFFALPNAAHHIDNSSSDDQKHDDDLMNNEQF